LPWQWLKEGFQRRQVEPMHHEGLEVRGLPVAAQLPATALDEGIQCW
jgi:hypothetical protein